MTWNADAIARSLARQLFNRQVLVVPRCLWTGYECDLLIVTRDLRLIDVEVKISASDLRADLKKDKWWQTTRPLHWGQISAGKRVEPKRREWPPKVWKHYYALPADIWRPGLAESIPQASGVLTLKKPRLGGPIAVEMVRRAKPCREAERIGAAEAIDLARLAGLRLWDALESLAKTGAPIPLPRKRVTLN